MKVIEKKKPCLIHIDDVPDGSVFKQNGTYFVKCTNPFSPYQIVNMCINLSDGSVCFKSATEEVDAVYYGDIALDADSWVTGWYGNSDEKRRIKNDCL